MTKSSPWHDNDEFWLAFAPFMFDEGRVEGTPEEVDKIHTLLEVEQGANILDMGCGPGWHSLELARRGYRITGIDVTMPFLELARQRAKEAGLDIAFHHADMRTYQRANHFDAALSLFTSFGYFEAPEENRQVLSNICHSLKSGGQFVLQFMGKEVLARIFVERDWVEKDGAFHLQERSVSKNWSWMQNRWILLKGGKALEYKIGHWIYSAAEITQMLQDVGFSTVKIYGSLDGDAYDIKAQQLVAVAQKA
jgi:SAM-dependent methyltransferase